MSEEKNKEYQKNYRKANKKLWFLIKQYICILDLHK